MTYQDDFTLPPALLGQGTSAVSFAWINARDKLPRHYHDLNRCSMDMWEQYAQRLGRDIGLTWGGEFRWAATADGANRLTKRVSTLQSWGYAIQLLNRAELSQLEPGLKPGPITAVSYSASDGHVDTGKVILASRDVARQCGAVVSACKRVTGLGLSQRDSRSTLVEAVFADAERIPCSAVVLAGGPDSPKLAKWAGIDLPLRHSFGATVITEPLPSILHQAAVVHTPPDRDPQIAIRQFRDGSVMLHGGAGGAVSDSLGKTEYEIKRILEAAAKYFPALHGARVKEVRRGRRPLPADGQSILGFTQKVPNLYLAATHSGVTLAPLIGKFATLEILEKIRIDLLEPYRLERF